MCKTELQKSTNINYPPFLTIINKRDISNPTAVFTKQHVGDTGSLVAVQQKAWHPKNVGPSESRSIVAGIRE